MIIILSIYEKQLICHNQTVEQDKISNDTDNSTFKVTEVAY
jgi:hypothetical protein